MTSPADRRDGGFTLIEILVVLAILAMSIGIVVGRGPARSPALDARGAVDQVARALRSARTQAIAGNHEVAFVLDVDRRAYRAGSGPWQTLPPTAGVAMLAAAEGGVAPGLGRIVFSPDGSATGGRIRVGAGSRMATVSVNWLTGRVAVDGG